MSAVRHVCFCSNDRGMNAAFTAVYSFLKSSVPVSTVVHLLHTDRLTAEHRDFLSGLVAKFSFASLEFHDLEPLMESRAAELRKVSGPWSIAIWGRWFIPDALSGVEGKVLYLDTDTLTVKDPGELFDLPMGPNVLGVVGEDNDKTGNFPSGERFYFSSGVLLMELTNFRAADPWTKLTEYLAGCGELSCPDQDALNHVFGDRTVYIHARWNFNDTWVTRHLKFGMDDAYWRGRPSREILESVVDPGIIHYIGGHKPWLDGVSRPESRRYRGVMRELGLAVPSVGAFAFFREFLYNRGRRIAAIRLKKETT